MVSTVMDHMLSGWHPARGTGAHLVASAACSNTRALSEKIIGSDSKKITQNYNLYRCAMAVQSAHLLQEELEYEPGKFHAPLLNMTTCYLKPQYTPK